MRRGDVVVAILPNELGKPRPAIVVQADELGQSTRSIVVCPLSSDLRTPARLRPIIEPHSENGLLVRSQVMTDKIVALPRDKIRRVIGALSTHAVEQVNASLLIVFGLAR